MPKENRNTSEEEVMEQLKALGYIDPGAGSSMWQVALAGFFRVSARIKALFGKSIPARDPEEE